MAVGEIKRDNGEREILQYCIILLVGLVVCDVTKSVLAERKLAGVQAVKREYNTANKRGV